MNDSPSSSRIPSIDVARGIIMVIMALDHVRDYIHVDAFNFDPTDVTKTSPALFFTRWVTHFCMPTFVLLSGVGIYINLSKMRKREISLFLLTRGLWLILLEMVVMRFALFFNFYFDITFLSVLWLFGACMILWSALIFLSYKTLLVLGVIITLGHDLVNMISVDGAQPFFGLWTILMNRGFLSLGPNHGLIISYPVIPWLGVMLLGYALGQMYTSMDQEKRQHRLTQLGIATIALFVTLRLINIYGDPLPWSAQPNGVFTFLSFLNTTKYPVSLLFTLMTIGPLFLLLAFLEKCNSRAAAPFLTIGRVPLFYFILHFYLIHAFALLLSVLNSGKAFSEIDFHFAKSFGGITQEGRVTLVWVYAFWICIVLLMYPLCKWYDAKKTTQRKWWMSYL